MSATVTGIWTTPVKGLALHVRERVQLGPLGVVENRRFLLVDGRGKLVNGKRLGELCSIRADWDADANRLALTFPDGRQLTEAVEVISAAAPGPDGLDPVCPELSAALSDFAGQPLTLLAADPAQTANDRGAEGTVSIISEASLAHLSGLAGESVDPRRFRMLFAVDGLEPHGEDAWVGQDVRVGGATVHLHGHVGRCRVTQMDPDTGATTLPTLDLLGYRKGLDTTEPLAFGIYGAVVVPGAVQVGDPVLRS